jgi:ribosome biogenesis GTPase A
MVKAKRMISENLKLVDMVIEILDARIPASSTNPDFQRLFENKIRLVLLNKYDYSDPEKTQLWIKEYKNQNITALPINSLNKNDINQTKKILLDLARKMQKEYKESKGINKTIRAMVVGIPNVGKSTFINGIAGRTKAKTGAKPGITRNKQWVKVNSNFELMDTPGLLWPKLDGKKTGLHLAYTGSIKEEILDLYEIVCQFLEDISKLYPQFLIDRYNLKELNRKGHVLLTDIAIKRNWLKSGGVPDLDRTAKQILDEYQTGLLGPITLEIP